MQVGKSFYGFTKPCARVTGFVDLPKQLELLDLTRYPGKLKNTLSSWVYIEKGFAFIPSWF